MSWNSGMAVRVLVEMSKIKRGSGFSKNFILSGQFLKLTF